MVFEACGAALNDASVGFSATPFDDADEPRRLGEQVVGYFPAPSAAFGCLQPGALEDITGASLPGGEPPFVGTP
jgi:hypothetical protein